MAVANALIQRSAFRWTVDQAAEAQRAERAISRALDLDRNDARIQRVRPRGHYSPAEHRRKGQDISDEAVSIDPNAPQALIYHANAQIVRNEPEKSIIDLDQVLRPAHLIRRSFIHLPSWLVRTILCDCYSDALQFATACASDPTQLHPRSYRAGCGQCAGGSPRCGAGKFGQLSKIPTRRSGFTDSPPSAAFRYPEVSGGFAPRWATGMTEQRRLVAIVSADVARGTATDGPGGARWRR